MFIKPPLIRRNLDRAADQKLFCRRAIKIYDQRRHYPKLCDWLNASFQILRQSLQICISATGGWSFGFTTRKGDSMRLERKIRIYSHVLIQATKSAQRRRKLCALAVVRRSQNFRPAADPLPEGAGSRPKCNQLEMMVTTFTYKPSFGEDRCTQFRVIVLTDPQTQPQTHTQTGPITIHCAAASAQCKSSSYTTKRTRIMMLQ